MASETTIKAGIERLVTTYSLWAIGLTDDPDRRVVEIGSPMGWRQFDADNEQVARNVDAYFVDKGMEGDTGDGVTAAKHVYTVMVLPPRLGGDRSMHQDNL